MVTDEATKAVSPKMKHTFFIYRDVLQILFINTFKTSPDHEVDFATLRLTHVTATLPFVMSLHLCWAPLSVLVIPY